MHWPRMKSSSSRPLILKRRTLPLSHGDTSGTLAREDSGRQDKGSLNHQQARTGEHSTNRKTPGTPKFPAGVKIISHPAMSDPPMVATPAGRNVLTIMEALAAKGNEWGSSKANKFVLLSSGSSSPPVAAREFNQLFPPEDKPSIPRHMVQEEDVAGPGSGAMKGTVVWASESQSMEGQEQEGNRM